MIEIFALIYLSRKIGNLADQKGQKRGLWQFYTVLAWFGAEIIGIFLSVLLLQTDELFALLPLAYSFAVGSYFLLKSVLLKKPDAVETSFEFEQHQ
jgi:hypothetical protein